MAYLHDIFISYRRDAETRAWLNDHLVPLLRLRVRQELASEPGIFVDDQLESGVSWPAQLGYELGCSRVLLALWARDYFASLWCTEEMAQMLSREKACGLRTDDKPRGLVVPAVIHDGSHFPRAVAGIQKFEIQTLFNVRMARDSPRAEQLDAVLTQQAPAIAAAIRAAPAWRKDWPLAAAAAFRDLLRTTEPTQASPPSFSD